MISCVNRADDKVLDVSKSIACTLAIINLEVDSFSQSSMFLDTIFHLNKEEVLIFKNKKSIDIKRKEREEIMLKFMAKLNDEKSIMTNCTPTERMNLKVGDIALYCLAKIEVMPFASATGRQNCTEPHISKDLNLPTNFIQYSHFKREQLTYHYLKYFYSQRRSDYLKEMGYD